MRRVCAVLVLTVLVPVPMTRAADDELATLQKQAGAQQRPLKDAYRYLEADLRQLADRLAKSARDEDRKRAGILQDARAHAAKQGIQARFEKLVDALSSKEKITSLQEAKEAIDAATLQADHLKAMRVILTEGRVPPSKAEKDLIQALRQLESSQRGTAEFLKGLRKRMEDLILN